ncbi:hypothetical protein BT96DRAFT_835318, partial [Gymnopus androsaceus JB14]
VTHPSLEATETARNEYLMQISQCNPSMLVFLDESATNRHTTWCNYAWSKTGQ